MIIAAYLKGKVAFEVTDEAISTTLEDREIVESIDSTTLTTQQKELLYADLLMYGSTKASSTTGEKKTHGGFSHTAKSETFRNPADWKIEANRIYKKYGDPKYVSQATITDASKLWQP